MIKKKERNNSFSVSRGTPIDKLLQFWRVFEVKKCIGNNDAVCDLGCGKSGEFLKEIRDIIASGTGIDIDVESSEDSKINLIKANLNDLLPIPDNSFDKIVSLAVIEHLDEYKLYLREAFRILSSGGEMIMTTPHPRGRSVLSILSFLKLIDRHEIEDHKNYFSPEELKRMLTDTGFSSIKAKTFQFGFNNLIIAQK